MSAVWTVDADCTCPMCVLAAEERRRRRQAGITRRRTRVLTIQAAWHAFAESTVGALIGCLAFFTALYTVLLMFPEGLHS